MFGGLPCEIAGESGGSAGWRPYSTYSTYSMELGESGAKPRDICAVLRNKMLFLQGVHVCTACALRALQRRALCKEACSGGVCSAEERALQRRVLCKGACSAKESALQRSVLCTGACCAEERALQRSVLCKEVCSAKKCALQRSVLCTGACCAEERALQRPEADWPSCSPQNKNRPGRMHQKKLGPQKKNGKLGETTTVLSPHQRAVGGAQGLPGPAGRGGSLAGPAGAEERVV